MTKAALRAQALAARSAAADPARAAAARAHLSALLAGREGVLAGYLPIRDEVDPVPVMAGWARPVCVPVVEGRGLPLSFARWRPGTALARGVFGAPIPAEIEAAVPSVLIVPLVAFDAAGNRLGYGGGYYDRTLPVLRAGGPVFAAGFAYAAQEVATIPAEPTDAPLDAIVTEEGVRLLSR